MGAQRITDLTSLAGGRGPATQHAENQTRSLTARGEVVIAPAAETDAMVCTVGSLSGVQAVVIPAGNWAPRGSTLPIVGNVCCIVYDDKGDAFVGSLWNPF